MLAKKVFTILITYANYDMAIKHDGIDVAYTVSVGSTDNRIVPTLSLAFWQILCYTIL